MNQISNNKLQTPSSWRGIKVQIPWKTGDNINSWNETCAWAMEEFGLPGTRYYTHAVEDYMDFYFYNEKDAIHFMLRWS